MSHYFGRRDDVVRAVMEDDLRQGAEPLATMAQPTGPFAKSMADAVAHLAAGFRYGGVGEMFSMGLTESLRHVDLGPAFLTSSLEPTLTAVEARLKAHIGNGEMRDVDPRGPAIALVAPILVVFLHQHELGGLAVRPLAIDEFLEDHSAGFVRAWRA